MSSIWQYADWGTPLARRSGIGGDEVIVVPWCAAGGVRVEAVVVVNVPGTFGHPRDVGDGPGAWMKASDMGGGGRLLRPPARPHDYRLPLKPLGEPGTLARGEQTVFACKD